MKTEAGNAIFTRVLTVGPDIKAIGGISSVLRSYRNILPSFTFCASNSRHGTIPGLFALAALIAKLPFYRLGGYNILHAHGASGKSYIRKRLVMRWARILGYKTIFHCHGGGFAAFATEFGADRIADELKKCDAVVTLTHGWAKKFSELFALEHIVVINNVVDFNRTALRSTKKVNYPIIGLFLGKVCKDKGIYDLIDVINNEQDIFRGKIKIVIGGNGETEELKKRISECGLENIVEYIGWISGELKSDVLAQADIIVLPSYMEGMPISILEGAALGIPSLTTAVGGIPEFVNSSNGILIEPGNKKQLSDALKFFIKTPAEIEKRGKAAKSAVKEYLPDAVIKSLATLYSSI